MNAIPTLYEWAGGQEALERLTTVFYARVLADELLGPVFARMGTDHPQRVAHFIAEVFAGPRLYTEGDHGSHAQMVAHHVGKLLDEPKRQRWLQLLQQAADEVGLPADPEFRSAFVGYLEWGSRLAVINSHASANPIGPGEPMPRWGWGETGGPYQPG